MRPQQHHQHALAPAQPESPGSVLSPAPAPGSAAASKPPIFSSPDVKNGAFKFGHKQKSDQSLLGSREAVNSLPVSAVIPDTLVSGAGSFRDPEKVKRRRSFNPNESAPPRPGQLTRPHSVYRMEHPGKAASLDRETAGSSSPGERRRSDFLSRYEELTCRAAAAIRSVDQIVAHERNGSVAGEVIPPSHPPPSLESPITPDVESVEFNEEEVLKTCQDFLDDYDRSRTGVAAPAARLPLPLGAGARTPPTPAPRLSLANRVDFPSSRYQATSASSATTSGQLSKEDEELLEAAQEKSFWDPKPSDSSVFERLENVNPEVFDSKIIRTRSSSLTIHDKCVEEKIKPILKKSTEDLAEHNRFPSILKTRDDFGLIPKTKHEGKYEHVRIRSPSFDRNEHVRIRSPSPDFEHEGIDLMGDADDVDGRSSSPESSSILKNRLRRTSVDGISFDLDDGEPQSILKRKSSFGSGSHSPEGNSENTRSILKKSSRNSSRTCSRSGSIEELDVESTKSILKSRNSSRTCSRSGSQEELDLDFDDDWETRPKSILKKKSGSTDDELDERPKSILKSRRSEESLSPNSDQVDTPSHSILRDGRSSSGTRQSSIMSDNEDILVISGRNSPSLRMSGRNSPQLPADDSMSTAAPRPILKNRDDPGPHHGILKRRERSSSPSPTREEADLRPESPPGQPRRAGRQQPRHLIQPATSEEVAEAADPSPPATAVASGSLPPHLDLVAPVSRLPPPSSAALQPRSSGSGRHRDRRHNAATAARFQTQPITVDEVEMARIRRDGSSTPEMERASLRPNQFLHSFSVDSATFSKSVSLTQI